MKKNLSIYLTDLAYLHSDDYIHPYPLNIGYIASYAKSKHEDIKIKLIKDPELLYKLIHDGSIMDVDVIGMSNYEWNYNLNKQFLELIKEKNKKIITIAGGPNIDIATEEEAISCLKEMKNVDIYIIGEGEYKFSDTIGALMAHDMDIEKIFFTLPKDVVRYDAPSNTLIRGQREDEPCDRLALPSPYLTGMLDDFFEDVHLAPIIETSRGCPFRCAFCYWGGSINSKLRKFPLKTVMKEIDYITSRIKNPNILLYITDGNFGIHKRDVAIAEKLNRSSLEENYPKVICMWFYKNFNDRLLKISDLLKDLTSITLSRQSLNSDVLSIIGRKNVPDAKYNYYYNKLQQIGASSNCDLIYPLPGESLDSFMRGLETMSRLGMHMSIYALNMNKGAKISSRYFREKYGIKTKYRVIPRYTGVYGDVASLEYEEVAVSHNLFTQDEFYQARIVLFLYSIFMENIFRELNIYINENEKNVIQYIKFILADQNNWPIEFAKILSEFKSSVVSELLEHADISAPISRDLVDRARSKGLALIPYYFCKLISSQENISSFKSYVCQSLNKFIDQNKNIAQLDEITQIVDFCFEKIINFTELTETKIRGFSYDFYRWVNSKIKDGGGKKKLNQYQSYVDYGYRADPEALSIFIANKKNNNCIVDSLYKTRMSFVTIPSKVYTYTCDKV